jgi:hypothetical protein
VSRFVETATHTALEHRLFRGLAGRQAVYNLHKLLWDIRKDPTLAASFRSDPYPILDEYGVEDESRTAMLELDFKKLHKIGANPYLIYFCAIQLGVDRAAYYTQIREEEN